MQGTHKMLKLLDHPCKPFGSYADILLVEPRLLVNNVRFAVPYLDDVNVRKTSSLDENVSRKCERGMRFRAPRPHES